MQTFSNFKVCKSVHHRTIQINHQPDATIFQFIILTFIYSSTCFGRFPAHHQELNECSGSLWFYLHIVVIAVLCSWSGRLYVIYVYKYIYIYMCVYKYINVHKYMYINNRPDHEHSTTVTTIRRQNQRLPLQSLSS